MGRPKSIVVVTSSYLELLDRFYQYQKRLGYVKMTCDNHVHYVREFLHWLEGRGVLELDKVDSSLISKYYTYLSERVNKQSGGVLSEKSLFMHMKGLNHLFRMLQSNGELLVNPMGSLRFSYTKSDEERVILSMPEINELYEVCEWFWERSILSLAYGCGLRVGEQEALNTEDIKLRDRLLIVRHGKGNKRRIIPLSRGVVKDLSAYFNQERDSFLAEGKSGEKAFMLNIKGGRMRKYTYQKYLKRLVSRTKNEGLINKQISIHNLRHSIATHLLERGIPLEQVRLFLGHRQLETTEIYTRVSMEQLKKLMEK